MKGGGCGDDWQSSEVQHKTRGRRRKQHGKDVAWKLRQRWEPCMLEEQLPGLAPQLQVGTAVLLNRTLANAETNRPNREPEKEVNFSPPYLSDFKVFLRWGFHFCGWMICLCTANKKTAVSVWSGSKYLKQTQMKLQEAAARSLEILRGKVRQKCQDRVTFQAALFSASITKKNENEILLFQLAEFANWGIIGEKAQASHMQSLLKEEEVNVQ